MPRDKSGKRITWKEFMQRWKKGVTEMSPFQQARIIYFNTYIMLFGILAGFFVTLLNPKGFWWLSIILIAAFINTCIVQVGNYQKYKTLKSIFTCKKEEKNVKQKSIHRF